MVSKQYHNYLLKTNSELNCVCFEINSKKFNEFILTESQVEQKEFSSFSFNFGYIFLEQWKWCTYGFYVSASIISPQLLFASNCCVSMSWKLLPDTFLMFPLLSFGMSFSGSFLRGLDENRNGDLWPFDFSRGLGVFRLFCRLAVNSNILAFSATEPSELEPPSKRSTFSDDEYRDNGVGVSSMFAGTAKFSRIRIDAKFTSWSRKCVWKKESDDCCWFFF